MHLGNANLQPLTGDSLVLDSRSCLDICLILVWFPDGLEQDPASRWWMGMFEGALGQSWQETGSLDETAKVSNLVAAPPGLGTCGIKEK